MSKSGRLDCPGTSPLASLPSTLIQIIMTFIELNAYWVFSLLSRDDTGRMPHNNSEVQQRDFERIETASVAVSWPRSGCARW